MQASRTNLGSLLAHVDETAVAALPNHFTLFGKYAGCLDVLHKSAIAFLVTLLGNGDVAVHGEFYFVKGDDMGDSVMQYDAFIYAQNRSRGFAPAPQIVDIWLYKDLTAYYQNKYPEANVKAVVIRYMEIGRAHV